MLRKSWMFPALLLGLLPGCNASMPDVSSMLPSLSSGGSSAAGGSTLPVSSVPRGPDPLAEFAVSATPGSVGTVNGERARMNRAYNAASGRECREVILGFGGSERVAVACRDASGAFVSSLPLMRGSAR